MTQSEERMQNMQKVIKTAQRLFLNEGIALVSINKIAAEAGLTPMSVYRYFGSKEKLIAAVWQDALVVFYDDFMKRYHAITADMATGYERFVACLELYIAVYSEFPQWFRYTREMFSHTSTFSITHSQDMEHVFWRYFDKEIPIPLLKALKDGVADGSVKPDINIYQVYQMVHNIYTGTSIYSNVFPDFDPLDTIKFTKELIANYIKNEK